VAYKLKETLKYAGRLLMSSQYFSWFPRMVTRDDKGKKINGGQMQEVLWYSGSLL
jgi:hypothetical protein